MIKNLKVKIFFELISILRYVLLHNHFQSTISPSSCPAFALLLSLGRSAGMGHDYRKFFKVGSKLHNGQMGARKWAF